MRHLIDVDDFDNDEIEKILAKAAKYKQGKISKTLKDKIIMTVFFENSTRTKSSFEVAAKRLGANVVNLDVDKSSTAKGETIEDTAQNLDAMAPDAIVVRHKTSGMAKHLSTIVSCPIVNGGDGNNAHPTQAILDLFTLKEHFGELNGRKLAIVGDIKNSRVASSNIKLLARFGVEVILVSPSVYKSEHPNRHVEHLREIIGEVDVIMSLRTQTERHQNKTYESLEEYGKEYCITKELIGKRDIILMHPGPVHRNIDISDEMLADSRSKVLEQVRNGVFVRMAILNKLIKG